MTEVWKDINGYEGLYQVSSLGRVKALEKVRTVKSKRWNCIFSQKFREHILVPLLGSNGRYHFTLHKDGRQKIVSRARIVANAFIPNPKGFPEVNHKDENIQNDLPENLEWCTHLYNMRYGSRTDRARRSYIRSTSRRILQFDKQGNLLHEYNCMADAQRETGCYSANISKCCLGKIRTHGGYVWRYA